jgi:hypothetical protein
MRHLYQFAVSENEAVIIEGYLAKKKVRMIFVQKADGQWNVKQDVDITDILEAPIDGIAMNGNWLAIDSDVRSNAVIVFKKVNDQWAFYSKINGNSNQFGNDSLQLNGHLLLIGNFNEDGCGAIFCYDLIANPHLLKQKITPPKELYREGGLGTGFGIRILSKDNLLAVCDSGAEFTNEEIKKYNITDQSGTKINDKELPVGRPSVLIFEKNKKEEWVFKQDLFYALPHPPNGILRSEEGSIVCFGESALSNHSFAIVNNQIILYDHIYYVFAKNSSGEWAFQYKIPPPFPPFWRKQRKKNGNIFLHFEHMEMDSVYAGHLDYHGGITLYKMIADAPWQAVNTFLFHKTPDDFLLDTEGYGLSFQISGNTAAALSCWFLDMKNKTDDKPVCTGKISIYEISSAGKPCCVFQMEAWDNGLLRPCPADLKSDAKSDIMNNK